MIEVAATFWYLFVAITEKFFLLPLELTMGGSVPSMTGRGKAFLPSLMTKKQKRPMVRCQMVYSITRKGFLMASPFLTDKVRVKISRRLSIHARFGNLVCHKLEMRLRLTIVTSYLQPLVS